MPSIRTCLGSLLLAALTISTSVDARVLNARDVTLLGDAHLSARSMTSPIKLESRDEAIERARLAKRKAIVRAKRAATGRKKDQAALLAAKKAKAAAARKKAAAKKAAAAAAAAAAQAQQQQQQQQVQQQQVQQQQPQPQAQQQEPQAQVQTQSQPEAQIQPAVVAAASPGRVKVIPPYSNPPRVPGRSKDLPPPASPPYYPPNGPFQKKCTSDANCLNDPGVPLPANGRGRCDKSRFIPICVAGCLDGYVPNGNTCQKSQPRCGATTCPTPPTGGGYLCGPMQMCELTCDSARGYTPVGNACINTLTDPNNCGTVGNVCADSYNGVGTPSCVSGTCTLTCPTNSVVRNSSQGLYCTRQV